MDQQQTPYEIGQNELTFIRTVALEFTMVQLFRRILRDRYNEEEVVTVCNEVFNVTSYFNEELNSEDEPQSKAWRAQLSQEFFRILSAIKSNDASWDRPR